jgi:hypothetical protein
VAERVTTKTDLPVSKKQIFPITLSRSPNPEFTRNAAKHFMWPNYQMHCKGCQAHHTLFICCQLSRIQISEFASGSSNEFSPSAQTLLSSAPSLVPSRVPPQSKGRQRFPRYFSTSNPRFEVRLSPVSGIAYASWLAPLSAYDVP